MFQLSNRCRCHEEVQFVGESELQMASKTKKHLRVSLRVPNPGHLLVTGLLDHEIQEGNSIELCHLLEAEVPVLASFIS
jgi:hypothetical protein